MAEAVKIWTPPFRASYVHIWSPQKSEDGKSDVYSVTGIFERDADREEMKRIAAAAREAKFGKNSSGKIKSPWRNGTSEEFDLGKNPEYRDKIIVPMRSYNRAVGVVGRDKKVLTDQSKLYSGCYCVAAITAFAWQTKTAKGVSFGLSSLMVVKDGEPLAGVSDPEEDFASFDTSEFGDDDLFGDLDDDEFDLG